MSEKLPPIDPKTDLKSDHYRHVSEQTFYASPGFNALRKELYENWNNGDVPGGTNYWYHIGGAMVHDPLAFVEFMTAQLGMVYTGFDSWSEAEHCKRILNALRKKRGLSELS